MSICAVGTCTNNHRRKQSFRDDLFFHQFPKIKSVCDQWIILCKRKDKINSKCARMCSDHFTSDDYERDLQNELLQLPLRRRGKLKPDAVPSLLLPDKITERSQKGTKYVLETQQILESSKPCETKRKCVGPCTGDDHRIEKCLICRQILDEISLSYSHSLGYTASTKIFAICCRVLKINERKEIPRWNFDTETLPFCVACMTCMSELSELYVKLDDIQKSIMKIKNATQIKILLAEHTQKKGKDCKATCVKYKRNKSFRNEAVKDFLPVLRMKNITERVNVLTERETNSENVSGTGLKTLAKSGNTVKGLITKTGDIMVIEESGVGVTRLPVKEEAIEVDCMSYSVLESEIKEETEIIFDENDYSAPPSIFEENDYSAPPSPFEHSPLSPSFDNFNEEVSDVLISKDTKSVDIGNFDNDIVHTVKSRKRKSLAGTTGRFMATEDNIHSDPDYSADDMQQDSEYESDGEKTEARSRRRRISDEATKRLCEGVEYSENDYGLFLCSKCHYSCTHMELLRHHIKKTHLQTPKNDNNITDSTVNLTGDEDDDDIIITDVKPKSSKELKAPQSKIVSAPASRTKKKKRKEKNVLICEGVKYSKNSSNLLLCSLCNFVCSSLEFLSKHIKSSHMATEGQVTVPVPLAEPEPNLNVSVNATVLGELPKLVYKQYDYTTNETDGKSECSTCKKSFNSREEVILHIQNDHVIPDNFEAQFVKRVYKHCEYLVSQDLRHCKCCKCNKMFRSRHAVILHINKEHDSPEFADVDKDKDSSKDVVKECEYKGFKYVRINSLMKCCTCNEKFKTRESTLAHISLIHAKEKLEIVVKAGEKVTEVECGKWRYKNIDFSPDESTGQLVCAHCNQKYDSLAAVQYHIRNVTGAHDRSAWVKSKKLGHNQWKVENIKYYKDEETGRYCCSLCEKGYNGRQTVMKHIRFIHLASKSTEGTSLTLQGTPRVKFLDAADTLVRLSENKWRYREMEFSKDLASGDYSCDQCGNVYKSKEIVKKHIQYIHGTSSEYTLQGTPRKVFIDPVNQSKRIGDGKWKYQNFEITKNKENGKYSCGKCGASYRLLETVKKHIKFIHLTSKDEYGRATKTLLGTERKCTWIPRENLGDGKFRWRGVEYSLAECNEEGLRQFHCFGCGYESTLRSHQNVKNHIRSRHYERTMECSECGKKFIGKRDLERHALSHKAEGTFQCDQCGVVTRSLGALIAHKKNVHLKIRHCICQYCGKGFFRQKDCTIHMRMHTGEKPYKCDFPGCTSSFSIKITLRKHRLTHDTHNSTVKRSRTKKDK